MNKRLALSLMLALAACSKQAAKDSPPDAPAPATPAAADPATFAPLQSSAVKDAIHRALRTGQTQRWQDSGLSGYAVPSADTGAHGCRTVRYTVDQRPEVPYETITACDAAPD